MRKFHFASICNVLPCELRLFWYSTRVLNRHLANKLPTCGQQSADKRPTVGRLLAEDFRKSGKRQSADYRPTVGRLSSNCWPTVGRLSADCRPTVGRQFFGGAVLHFFQKFSYHGYILNKGKKILSRFKLSSWPRERKLNLKLSIFQLKRTFCINCKYNNTCF